MIKPALHDIIETLYPLEEAALPVGTAGTIVHVHDGSAYEVEFSDETGQSLAIQPLTREQFVVVWQAESGQTVSLPEQVAQIVALLPDGAGAEVLDFARYLSWRRLLAEKSAAA